MFASAASNFVFCALRSSSRCCKSSLLWRCALLPFGGARRSRMAYTSTLLSCALSGWRITSTGIGRPDGRFRVVSQRLPAESRVSVPTTNSATFMPFSSAKEHPNSSAAELIDVDDRALRHHHEGFVVPRDVQPLPNGVQIALARKPECVAPRRFAADLTERIARRVGRPSRFQPLWHCCSPHPKRKQTLADQA